MTGLSAMQERIKSIRQQRGFVTDPLKIQLLLTEEVGEISAELKRLWSKNYDGFDSARLAEEIADVFVLLSALASEFEIDIEQAVTAKFFGKDAERGWRSEV
jgi:NTP pyrophosphatase (non-canonical NTP hydrolase)